MAKSKTEDKQGFPSVDFEQMKRFFDSCTEFNLKLMNSGINLTKDGIDQDTHKKFFEAWQEALGEYLDKYLRSPEFCEHLAKSLNASTFFKKHYDQMLVTTLKKLKLPTRDDLQDLYNRIDTIEEKVDLVLEKLEKR